ncbi:MAG TPA: M28 family peptidase [Bacteroidia bacterium]|nr:M28 family peptidase [Bacteroidia bacterium]
MKQILSFFFALAITFSLHAQDRAFAKQVVDTLASPSMHGRGYVNKGDKIAAKYISDEYKSFGLLSFNMAGSYYQEFTFPVNTFPGNMSLTVTTQDGKKVQCVPGQQFLVRPESPSVKGNFPVVLLDSAIVYDDAKWTAFRSMNLKKSFVMVDTSGVRGLRQLQYMKDFAQYPHDVKGLLFPVKPNPIAGSDNCSKLSPWDFSMKQSAISSFEIDYAFRRITAIEVNVTAKFLKNYKSQNVIGYVRGSEEPDSFIVFTAHYDHLGQMGKDTYFPGANDNASGIAMLLSLARYYSMPEHKPKCSIVFMAFSAEEVGLIGSRYFTMHPLFPMKAIRFLINMDILGTGDEGITVVNATLFDPEFKKLQKMNSDSSYLAVVKPRGKAPISDHFFFTEWGVPSFYIYTLGGIKAYHDTCDRRETLPLTKFESLFALLRDFADWEDRK